MSSTARAIHQAFVVMLARNLESSPAAEDLAQIAEVLEHDLVRAGLGHMPDEAIVRALNNIGLEVVRWPCTAQIISKVRTTHVEWKQADNVACFPTASPDDARKNIQRIREMLSGVGKQSGPDAV